MVGGERRPERKAIALQRAPEEKEAAAAGAGSHRRRRQQQRQPDRGVPSNAVQIQALVQILGAGQLVVVVVVAVSAPALQEGEGPGLRALVEESDALDAAALQALLAAQRGLEDAALLQIVRGLLRRGARLQGLLELWRQWHAAPCGVGRGRGREAGHSELLRRSAGLRSRSQAPRLLARAVRLDSRILALAFLVGVDAILLQPSTSSSSSTTTTAAAACAIHRIDRRSGVGVLFQFDDTIRDQPLVPQARGGFSTSFAAECLRVFIVTRSVHVYSSPSASSRVRGVADCVV